MTRPISRLPHYIPDGLKRRIEVDLYLLHDFVTRAAQSLPPGARVLDAGSGSGQYKALFAHTRYHGVDLGVGNAAWDYAQLDAVNDLTHLAFGDGIFDAAICTQVLEHVAEPLCVLQEIWRVLKPGGRLFLTAPQSWPQHQKPHDFYRYTSFGLHHLFARAGFRVQSIQNMGGYFWFLSFQLQNINFWLFPRDMRGRHRTWPIRAVLGAIFQFVVPLMLYPLDRLDRVKDETFGYLCVAVKPDCRT